jgi:SIR2-like domain
MKLILLTGAGFTRNWGGWLANEAFEYVLGRPEVSEELRRRLWEDKFGGRGFEDTLADLQRLKSQQGDGSASEMVQQFMTGLRAMFGEMNQGLSKQPFEWQNETSMMIRPFLSSFDYIFTLNQDLLLECHYLSDGSGRGKFNGVQMPGMKPLDRIPLGDPVATKDVRWTRDAGNIEIKAGLQPYIKLHGSSNWIRQGAQPPLIVLGGGKEVEIAQDPLLNRYQQIFSEVLRERDAKLMVIGYSFGDDHINKAISDAADLGKLTIFIVDPSGVDVFKRTMTLPEPITYPWNLRQRLSPHIHGASRRPLSATFGHHRVEHGKLMAFLAR